MSIVQIAQSIGVVSILLLFGIKFFIVIHTPSWQKTGRVAMLWTTIYVFFLFILRVLSAYDLATLDQLRIISGFSSLIPLIAVITHLFFIKKLDEDLKEIKNI